MKRLFGLFWVVILLCGARASADAPDQIRHAVAAVVLHHIIYLHHAYHGAYLHFDENGRLLNHVVPGYWTDTGGVYPTKVEVNSAGVIHIEGERVATTLDQKKANWHGIRRETVAVVIEVQLGPAHLTVQQARSAISSIFAMSIEELAPELPAYWRPCVTGVLKPDPAEKDRIFCFDKNVTPDMQTHAPVSTDAQRITPAITAPIPYVAPGPRFTDAAREAHFNGTALLWVIVSEQGLPEEIYVASPVGYGLDDEAVNALATWRFTPARRNGKPVRVQMTIDINFKTPVRGRFWRH